MNIIKHWKVHIYMYHLSIISQLFSQAKVCLFTLFIIIMGTTLSSCAQTGALYKDMDVEQFSRFISEKGVQLLDVRTSEEFSEGHIGDAENINLFDNNFYDTATKALDKSRPVAVYCRSGKRSAEAASILSKEGYDVTNLEGGIIEWIEAGEPIEE